jgi:hypothetical protein
VLLDDEEDGRSGILVMFVLAIAVVVVVVVVELVVAVDAVEEVDDNGFPSCSRSLTKTQRKKRKKISGKVADLFYSAVKLFE